MSRGPAPEPIGAAPVRPVQLHRLDLARRARHWDVLVRLAPASLVVGACGDGTLAALQVHQFVRQRRTEGHMAVVVHALQFVQPEPYQHAFELGEAQQVIGLLCAQLRRKALPAAQHVGVLPGVFEPIAHFLLRR